MPRKVLVFARDEDLHADAVISHCVGRGAEVMRCDISRMLDGIVIAAVSFGSEGPSLNLRHRGKSFASGDDLAIYCREYDLPAESSSHDLNRTVSLEETRAFLDAWSTLVPHECWVDHPRKQARFDNKIIQTALAQSVGLKIPKTIATNDPDRVREFARDSRVVIKQLSNIAFVNIDEASECIYTTPVDEASLQHVSDVACCPVLLQSRVEKIADLRVTVVGKKTFPAVIRSRPSAGIDTVDFRAMTEEAVEVASLPPAIEGAILDMMARMRLRFAAFDFGVTAENGLVFFEANVTGNWLWVEHATGLPISAEIAQLLLSQAAQT